MVVVSFRFWRQSQLVTCWRPACTKVPLCYSEGLVLLRMVVCIVREPLRHSSSSCGGSLHPSTFRLRSSISEWSASLVLCEYRHHQPVIIRCHCRCRCGPYAFICATRHIESCLVLCDVGTSKPCPVRLSVQQGPTSPRAVQQPGPGQHVVGLLSPRHSSTCAVRSERRAGESNYFKAQSSGAFQYCLGIRKRLHDELCSSVGY